jgi:DNA-directed RNA polymerase I, II, and III subunit RPABC1
MNEKIDKIEHEFVPEHTKLSEKDAKTLMSSYFITLRELPKISISDPAIAHLDVKEGDVIKIKRASRTAGDTVFYRGVLKD